MSADLHLYCDDITLLYWIHFWFSVRCSDGNSYIPTVYVDVDGTLFFFIFLVVSKL